MSWLVLADYQRLHGHLQLGLQWRPPACLQPCNLLIAELDPQNRKQINCISHCDGEEAKLSESAGYAKCLPQSNLSIQSSLIPNKTYVQKLYMIPKPILAPQSYTGRIPLNRLRSSNKHLKCRLPQRFLDHALLQFPTSPPRLTSLLPLNLPQPIIGRLDIKCPQRQHKHELHLQNRQLLPHAVAWSF